LPGENIEGREVRGKILSRKELFFIANIYYYVISTLGACQAESAEDPEGPKQVGDQNDDPTVGGIDQAAPEARPNLAQHGSAGPAEPMSKRARGSPTTECERVRRGAGRRLKNEGGERPTVGGRGDSRCLGWPARPRACGSGGNGGLTCAWVADVTVADQLPARRALG